MPVTVCSWPAWVQCAIRGNRNRPCLLSRQALPTCLCSGAVGQCPGIILPVGMNPFPLPFLLIWQLSVGAKLIQRVSTAGPPLESSYTYSGDSWTAKSKRGCASQGAVQMLILSSHSGAASVILLFGDSCAYIWKMGPRP